MNFFYHREDCPGVDEFGQPAMFIPSVCKNKAGYYVAMECFTCHVHNRESGYYDDEPSAWSDYGLMIRGLPITNPREQEGEDDTMMRRLKAAGRNPKPDEGNDPLPAKPARIQVSPDGSVIISLEDPLGAAMDIRLYITPWGLIGVTNTGFGSVVTEEGVLAILPDSDHPAESQKGLMDSMRELDLISTEEVNQDTPNIDAESIA